MISNKWWDKETPIIAETKKNVLRWFPDAGKLQVSLPNWVDDAGETMPGKTVTLDMVSTKDSIDAVALLRSVIGYVEGNQ